MNTSGMLNEMEKIKTATGCLNNHLFVLNVGVNSPPEIERSRGRIVNFWIFAGLRGTTDPSLLVSVIALVINAMYSALRAADDTVLTPATAVAAAPSRLSDPGSSPPPVSSVLSVISAVQNLRWSPIITTFETAEEQSGVVWT